MQKADIVLSILRKKSKNDEQYKYDRIYRNFFNRDLYLRAYSKIYAKEGNMTAGTDGKTIDGFSKKNIESLIARLKTEEYYPNPVRRTYRKKKNGKMRPLGIPSFEDKLVQEVVRQILEAIYEPLFSENSHGFRTDRSCHTALMQIKRTARGSRWAIEGDITGCFDNIDHNILLSILSEKIKDGRFIELIRRFLKAGYYEFNEVKNSYSGCPQGTIISPILSNIYLNEFDRYMEEMTKAVNTGKVKRATPEYKRLYNKRCTARKNGDIEKAEQLLREMRRIPANDPMDNNFIRMKYVRYADDFVILVDGNKKLAYEVKDKITVFLKERLNLELNADKTLITNLKDGRVKFLGYEIVKSQCDTKITKNKNGETRRTANGKIQLLVPSAVIAEKIRKFSAKGKPAAFTARANMTILDMIQQYNSEIRGLYNYYCLATDVGKKLHRFKFYHYYSLVKTIARKEKSSVAKVIDKYGIDVPRKKGTGTRRIVGVKYRTKHGEQTMTYFNDSLKKIEIPAVNIDDSYRFYYDKTTQLIVRLNADTCELCGSQENVVVHHVRKLKDIKQKYRRRGKHIPDWVLMMSKMNRKTLVVCERCHNKIHSGK